MKTFFYIIFKLDMVIVSSHHLIWAQTIGMGTGNRLENCVGLAQLVVKVKISNFCDFHKFCLGKRALPLQMWTTILLTSSFPISYTNIHMEEHSGQKCNWIRAFVPLDCTLIPLNCTVIPLDRTFILLDHPPIILLQALFHQFILCSIRLCIKPFYYATH